MANKNTTPLKIGMVLFSHYPGDARPRRECEALTGAGMSVDMICLKGEKEPRRETVNNVSVYRIPVRKKRGSKARFLFEYILFFILAFIKLSLLQLRRRYHVVQAHNMPDFLIFTAIIPRLMGAKLILDLHDPMPEVFAAKYGVSRTGLFMKILRLSEKLSIRFADLVLTPNKAFRDIFASRNGGGDKIRIVMNSPQETLFQKRAGPNPRTSPVRERYVMMCHGTIVERHGIDIALEALNRVKERIEGVELNVYGKGDFVGAFLKKRDGLGLGEIVHYHGHIPVDEIPGEIEKCHIGLIPNRKSEFTDLNFPT